MSEFIYNNIVLNKKDSLENLMIKYLQSKYGDTTKHLTTPEFLQVLANANFTNSLDIFILKLKRFNFDLTSEKCVEAVKPYLATCMQHSILKLNKQIKSSKINNASYYRTAGAQTGFSTINDKFIDSRVFNDECDFLINYLTNAILCGEIILMAEQQSIKSLKQNKAQLENETVTIIDSFIRNTLNIDEILNATNPEEIAELLKRYKKETPSQKK